MMKSIFWKFIILFALGVIFRLWISHLAPQPFVFDQTEYHNFALQMLERGLNAWQSRLYGYPLFLAVIYKIFGAGNFAAVTVIQSMVDCLTAVLIFAIAKKIFKNQMIAWFSYILYLFNPFTSVFVILTLSEILSIFLMTGITYLLILIAESLNVDRLYLSRLTPLFGLVALFLGYLPQVRPAFLIYCVILILVLIVWVIREMGVKKGIVVNAVAVIFFILPFTYNIVGNWIYFKQLSPMTVDNLFIREFYISLYVPGRMPVHTGVFPEEVQKIYNEYTPVPTNAKERQAMAAKYLNLGLEKVTDDPLAFVFSRMGKFWFVWEKHFLFYYTQPENTLVDFLTYWGNNVLLLSAALGFIIWHKNVKKGKYFWFRVFIVFIIGYISALHSFSLTDERFSLPGYPLVFLFAGYGIWNIIKIVFRHSEVMPKNPAKR